MTLLLDLGNHLDTATIATQDLTIGVNLFLGRLPDTPDTCVSLYQASGGAPVDQFGSAAPQITQPSVQVRARAADYSTAEALANDVWGVLVLVANATLTSTRYLRLEAKQTPFPLERDTQDRVVFVFNLEAIKET
jgi:hypothetical protein